MQIIKDNSIAEDHWRHITDEPIPNDGCISVSVTRWKAEKNLLLSRHGDLGIRMSPEDSIEEVASDLMQFQLIALEFPIFTDGRSFSTARLLRSRYHYQGELRAIGDFLRDQIFFLTRVGFNSLEFNDENKDLQETLAALNDFSVTYQSSTDAASMPASHRLTGR